MFNSYSDNDQLMMTLVQNDINTFPHIKNPSREVILTALKINPGYIIQHISRSIKDGDLEIQTIAVNDTWWSICYIDNLYPDIQLVAIKQDKRALVYFKCIPTDQAIQLHNMIWKI